MSHSKPLNVFRGLHYKVYESARALILAKRNYNTLYYCCIRVHEKVFRD